MEEMSDVEMEKFEEWARGFFDLKPFVNEKRKYQDDVTHFAWLGWVNALQSRDDEIAPRIPTEFMWYGDGKTHALARDIMMGLDLKYRTTAEMLEHLKRLGQKIPSWLDEELKNNRHLATGDCCVLIYRAMYEQALSHPQKPKEEVMPKLYRKKPVVIEAALLELGNIEQVAQWCSARICQLSGLEINTLEGIISASIGDYIIRGVKGEFYSCKPDIFSLTYEYVGTYEYID